MDTSTVGREAEKWAVFPLRRSNSALKFVWTDSNQRPPPRCRMLASSPPPLHRGAFFQFPFRWNYAGNKFTGKKTWKIHLCVLCWCLQALRRNSCAWTRYFEVGIYPALDFRMYFCLPILYILTGSFNQFKNWNLWNFKNLVGCFDLVNLKSVVNSNQDYFDNMVKKNCYRILCKRRSYFLAFYDPLGSPQEL